MHRIPSAISPSLRVASNLVRLAGRSSVGDMFTALWLWSGKPAVMSRLLVGSLSMLGDAAVWQLVHSEYLSPSAWNICSNSSRKEGLVSSTTPTLLQRLTHCGRDD